MHCGMITAQVDVDRKGMSESKTTGLMGLNAMVLLQIIRGPVQGSRMSESEMQIWHCPLLRKWKGYARGIDDLSNRPSVICGLIAWAHK